MATPTPFLPALLMLLLVPACAAEMMMSVEGGDMMGRLLLTEKQNHSGSSLVTSREVRLAPAAEKYVEDGIDRYSGEDFLTFGALLVLSLVVLRFLRSSGTGSSLCSRFFSFLGNLGKSRLFWLLLLLSLPTLCSAVTPEEILDSFLRYAKIPMYGVALVNAGLGIFLDLGYLANALDMSICHALLFGGHEELLDTLISIVALILYHLSTLPSSIPAYYDGSNGFSLLNSLRQLVWLMFIFCTSILTHRDFIGRRLREHVTAVGQWLLLCCSAVLILFLF